MLKILRSASLQEIDFLNKAGEFMVNHCSSAPEIDSSVKINLIFTAIISILKASGITDNNLIKQLFSEICDIVD